MTSYRLRLDYGWTDHLNVICYLNPYYLKNYHLKYNKNLQITFLLSLLKIFTILTTNLYYYIFREFWTPCILAHRTKNRMYKIHKDINYRYPFFQCLNDGI